MRSCWDCLYQEHEGITFLGYCTYFLKLNKEKKEIPNHIIDKGCKFYKKDE